MSMEFIKERDRRKSIIEEKGLVSELQNLVMINNKPISSRTVKDTFKVNSYKDLEDTRLRVWIASGKLIESLEAESEKYSK